MISATDSSGVGFGIGIPARFQALRKWFIVISTQRYRLF
jgi:hypothetical protein